MGKEKFSHKNFFHRITTVAKFRAVVYNIYVMTEAEKTSQQYYDKMTKTPVAKLVALLGIPTTVSMLISGIYNMADTYFVSTLGKSATGAVSILFTLQAMIQAVAFMLGHGSGTYVAKELANRDNDKATMYVSTAFFIGGAFGLVFAALGLCLLAPFMRLLGSTETILPYAMDYGMWVFIGCPFLIMSLVLNNNLRYEGKATYAMVGLVSGGILNILLDYVFVIVCSMGVFGAGLATAISQVVSFVLLVIFYLLKAQSTIRFSAISKSGKTYLQILKNGFPSFVRQGFNCLGSGILNHVAGRYGAMLTPDIPTDGADATISAIGIVNRVATLVLTVGLGIGQGLQPVASYNYQLKEYARVKRAVVATCLINLGVVVVVGIPVAIFAPQIVGVFDNSPLVLQTGIPALRYAMCGMMFMPLSMPICMCYQSIRKARVATLLAMLRNGLVFIPVLFIVTALWQVVGVQIAQPLSDAISGLISLPFLIHFLTTTPKE